jgi:hypothetical protein
MTVTSQRLQASVDAFRTRKEAIKAAWAAADATVEAMRAVAAIEDAMAEVDDMAPLAVRAAAAAAGSDREPAGGGYSSMELWELLPEASDPAGIRVLFTVEEPDTAALLAIGGEEDRLAAWYAQAVLDCRVRYQQGSTG